MEFGEPHLHIREPRIASEQASEKVKKNAARRLVTVHGDWHLWVHSCDWRISFRGQELANQGSSRRAIGKALFELNGQALGQVHVYPSLLSTFEFDLGGKLEVIPNSGKYGASSDLWLLYEPAGDVFTLRGDAKFCHGSGETRPEEEVWHTLEICP